MGCVWVSFMVRGAYRDDEEVEMSYVVVAV